MTMRHVIRKQVIDLNIEPGFDSFRVQQKLSDYFYAHIAPALEKLFDQISDPNQVLSIDKLHLDLGVLAWNENDFEVDEKILYQRLKSELDKALHKMIENREPDKGNIRETAVEEHACVQWIHYMKHGFLPWGINHTDDEWRNRVLETLAVDHEMINLLKSAIVSNQSILNRLVKDHRESFLVKLAEVLTANPQNDLPKKIEGLVQKAQQSDQDNLSPGLINPLYYWEKLLFEFAAGKRTFDGILEITQAKELTQDNLPDMAINYSNIAEGIFISNAGLVLLHPFYKTLFDRTGLLQNGGFVNHQEQATAVLILHFIATGRTENEEHELVVPKIICGMALGESIGFLNLSEELKSVADNMIEAAIGQWPILKNTSPTGLREGFLQRKGKLFIKENSLVFNIESSGIDVLLDHLPWNLSMIKFPWLKELIKVDWR